MKWNVFYYNINKRKIEIYNIFEHSRFCEDIKNSLKKVKNKNEFAKVLKSNLMYYFWSKIEWELIFSSCISVNPEKDSIRVDVYEQIMNNFDVLVDYVWKNRKELLYEWV